MITSDFYGIRTRLISAVTVRRPHPATPEADNNILKCLLFESNELLLGFNQALLPKLVTFFFEKLNSFKLRLKRILNRPDEIDILFHPY